MRVYRLDSVPRHFGAGRYDKRHTDRLRAIQLEITLLLGEALHLVGLAEEDVYERAQGWYDGALQALTDEHDAHPFGFTLQDTIEELDAALAGGTE